MADREAETGVRGEECLGPASIRPGTRVPDGERDDWGTPFRMVAFTVLTALVVAAASILPYAGVGLVLLAPFLRRACATLGPRRAGLAPPIALFLASPVLLLMPLLMMTDPVVESGWRCGTAQMGGLVAMPMMAFIAGLVASAGALVLVGFMPRVVAAVAPWTRAAFLVLSALLLIAGSVRLVRFPPPEDWTGSLRVAGVGPGLDTAQLGTCREGCPLAPMPFQASGEERTLLLECKTDRCTMRLGNARGATLGHDSLREGAASPGAPVEIRVHDGLGVAVVVQQGRSMVAFDVRSGEVVNVPLRDVAREVAPSAIAVLAMAFAVAVAVQRTRRAYGERAAVKRLRMGISARIDDAGVVHPDDAGASFRPPGATMPEGPAVVLGRPASRMYRSGADRGTWVLPGTLASHVEAHLHRAAVFDWEALAVIGVAGAPLFAAALRGLLL